MTGDGVEEHVGHRPIYCPDCNKLARSARFPRDDGDPECPRCDGTNVRFPEGPFLDTFPVPLPDVAAGAVAEYFAWTGAASTRRAVDQQMQRLRTYLKATGHKIPNDPLERMDWKGTLLDELWEAGFYLNTDEDKFRLLLPEDEDQWTPTGPTIEEFVDLVREQAVNSLDHLDVRNALRNPPEPPLQEDT